jgi:hypothetical protein
MKLGFQVSCFFDKTFRVGVEKTKKGNNGNGRKPLVTSDNLKFACAELGIPDDAHTLRRAARAFDLYHSGKVEHVNNHTFKVASQYDRERPYRVQIKQTPYLKALCYAYCTCQDWMNYSGDQDLPDVNFWCKHSIAALVWLHNNGSVRCVDTTPSTGNGKREFTDAYRLTVVNECGSALASALQDKLNGQLNSQQDNGNSRFNRDSQPTQLDLSDPFQEAEALDIAQIEGRSNGDLAWKLRNGEYCISYRGIMTLAEKHSIEFDEVSLNDNTVIAKAKNGNERISGKPIYDNANTAIELAKRNAARQLLPLPEIKAVEKKAQLEAEFDWQKAQGKCIALVGEANVSIIIHDLTQAGKLRADNPSHYDRTEWLLIYDACKRDAQVERDPKSLNRWSYNSVEFLERCKEAIAKVREEKKCIEANEMPACDAGCDASSTTPSTTRRLPQENGNGKRKLQMDKKLRTWLIEADGTKSQITCREICETFESKQNPSIVTRLRAGIDSGADISTVELN